MLIGQLEQVVSFVNRVFMQAPRLREFFDVLDTVPTVRDRPDAIDVGRLSGLVEFDDVSFSYDGKRPAVADLSFTALPGETIALVGPTGAGKIDRALAAAPRLRSAVRRDPDRRHRHPRASSSQRCAATSAWCSRSRCCSTARSPTICASASPTPPRRRSRRRPPARPGARLHRAPAARLRHAGRRARPLAVGRRAPAALDRARAAEGPADPDPRRGDQRARRRPPRRKRPDGARRGDEGPHHLRDRASPLDRSATPRASWCSSTAASSRPAPSTNWWPKGGRFAELAKAQFMVQENARTGVQRPTAGEAAVKA